MNKSSFINEHAYDRHKYNPKKKSTPNDTQYGRNVDVKKLREETMNNYDNKWSQTDKKEILKFFTLNVLILILVPQILRQEIIEL